MKPINVELRIEELVLYGFASGGRSRLGRAMEHELARLFAEHGIPPSLAQGGGTGWLDGGSFNVEPGATPEAIGRQVAQTVYGGLRR